MSYSNSKHVTVERDWLETVHETIVAVLLRPTHETKPPHCIHCHCEEAAKGMVDRGDFDRFRNAVLKIAHDEHSDAYETCEDGQDDYWRVVNIARSAASGKDPGSPEDSRETTALQAQAVRDSVNHLNNVLNKSDLIHLAIILSEIQRLRGNSPEKPSAPLKIVEGLDVLLQPEDQTPIEALPDGSVRPLKASECSSGELAQLRRIDKAARVYVDNRTHGNYSKMCDALFGEVPPEK